MSAITPSVGRKVWFYASGGQLEPIDATVIKVNGDPHAHSLVNLDVFDPDTGAHSCEQFVVVGDETTTGRHYRWMPYQQSQAKAAAQPPATDAHVAVGATRFSDGKVQTMQNLAAARFAEGLGPSEGGTPD